LVHITATLSHLPDEAREILQKAKQARKRATPVPPALRVDVVPVSDVHPILAATAKKLRKAKSDGARIVTTMGQGLLGTRVGSDNVERGIALLDMRIRRLLDNALPVGLADKGVKVGLAPDFVVFMLKERTRWQPHVPTVDELAAERRRPDKLAKWQAGINLGSWPERAYPEQDERLTGLLALKVDRSSDGIRRRWADGKTQTLEKLVDSIVTGLEAVFAADRSRRMNREEGQRNYAVAERRRGLAKRRQERENKRVELLKQILAWEQEAAQIDGGLLGSPPSRHPPVSRTCPA